jgi:hypothetical protein
MSKLLDYLQVHSTGERRHVPPPLKMVTSQHSSYDLRVGGYATVYRVEARLGAQVTVSDETKQAIDWETLMRDKVYRPLAEEVFGEFREPLLEADLAITQGDTDKASKLIHNILDSMFKV